MADILHRVGIKWSADKAQGAIDAGFTPKGLALSLASLFMKPVLCILLATANC